MLAETLGTWGEVNSTIPVWLEGWGEWQSFCPDSGWQSEYTGSIVLSPGCLPGICCRPVTTLAIAATETHTLLWQWPHWPQLQQKHTLPWQWPHWPQLQQKHTLYYDSDLTGHSCNKNTHFTMTVTSLATAATKTHTLPWQWPHWPQLQKKTLPWQWPHWPQLQEIVTWKMPNLHKHKNQTVHLKAHNSAVKKEAHTHSNTLVY